MAPPDPYKIVLPVLPQEVGTLTSAEGASGDLAEWHRRLTKLRQDQAAALFASGPTRRPPPPGVAGLSPCPGRDQGQSRPRGGPPRLRLPEVPEPVAHAVRGADAPQRHGLAREVRLDRKGQSAALRCGRAAHGRHLDRCRQRRRAARRDHHGWDIETEHYRIRTNHSIEAAVALGVKLENLHRIWRQVFLGYYASAADVEALFSGRPRRQPPKSPPRWTSSISATKSSTIGP